MNPPKAQVVRDGITLHGWKITTVKGPIIADRDSDAFRQEIGNGGLFSLPEMLFDQNRISLLHEPTGISIDLNARDALKAWREADPGTPLQVSVAQAWKSARQGEIQLQKAVQLDYDWTYTTPYSGSVIPAGMPSCSGAGAEGHEEARPTRSTPSWQETTEQIDRSMLMERDPILFFDEVILYESDLDDNGVCLLTAKLRVMPKCWFLLLRLWIRVDGSMVRLRETRLFCRHDLPHVSGTVIREVKCCEGAFGELRAAGAPEESSGSYSDADSASAVFQAIAPVGVKLFRLDKLQLA